jgi:hypothetical protein
MNAEYIAKVNLKREIENVSALSLSGMSVSGDTYQIATTLAKSFLIGEA